MHPSSWLLVSQTLVNISSTHPYATRQPVMQLGFLQVWPAVRDRSLSGQFGTVDVRLRIYANWNEKCLTIIGMIGTCGEAERLARIGTSGYTAPLTDNKIFSLLWRYAINISNYLRKKINLKVVLTNITELFLHCSFCDQNRIIPNNLCCAVSCKYSPKAHFF